MLSAPVKVLSVRIAGGSGGNLRFGWNISALYTAYSDHGNGCVLLVSAPLLPAVRFGQPKANPYLINGRKALAKP
jgi:hypothetical protein